MIHPTRKCCSSILWINTVCHCFCRIQSATNGCLQVLLPSWTKIVFHKVIFTHAHAWFELSQLPSNVCILNNCPGRKCWGFQVISKAAVFPSPLKAADKIEWNKQALHARCEASIHIFWCIHNLGPPPKWSPLFAIHFFYWGKAFIYISVLTHICSFFHLKVKHWCGMKALLKTLFFNLFKFLLFLFFTKHSSSLAFWPAAWSLIKMPLLRITTKPWNRFKKKLFIRLKKKPCFSHI